MGRPCQDACDKDCELNINLQGAGRVGPVEASAQMGLQIGSNRSLMSSAAAFQLHVLLTALVSSAPPKSRFSLMRVVGFEIFGPFHPTATVNVFRLQLWTLLGSL